MALRDLKISHYKDEIDKVEYRFGETDIGEKHTKVWARKLNSNDKWASLTVLPKPASRIKSEIKYRTKSYDILKKYLEEY